MALTGTISGGDVVAYPDYIRDGYALPNATNHTSSAFRWGGTQAAVELVIKFIAATTLSNTYRLLIEVLECDTEDGSFGASAAAIRTVFDQTAGVSGIDWAAGADIRYPCPTDALRWGKLKVTTTENLSAKTYDAYLAMICR